MHSSRFFRKKRSAQHIIYLYNNRRRRAKPVCGGLKKPALPSAMPCYAIADAFSLYSRSKTSGKVGMDCCAPSLLTAIAEAAAQNSMLSLTV